MKKIQGINIVYLFVIFFTFILLINGATFGKKMDLSLFGTNWYLSNKGTLNNKLVSDPPILDISNTVTTFVKGLNCPNKIRFNGLSWECNLRKGNMEIYVTDNSGKVFMSDYININPTIIKANYPGIIEPYEFNGAYILLTDSRPLTSLNKQTRIDISHIVSQQTTDLDELILATPSLRDILTFTTFEKDLTLTANTKDGYDPTNLSKLNSWALAQADWDKIVSSSSKYIYYSNQSLICNQNNRKLQENSAVKLLCSEIIGVE